MSTSNKEPELQDEVKHKLNDTAGVVIAKYPGVGADKANYLDVRGFDNKIHYGTPAANWIVTKPCDELEGL